MGAHGRGKAEYHSWLPPALSPGAGQQKTQGILRYLSLPAGYLLSSVTERTSGSMWVAFGRVLVSHQLVAGGIHQVDTDSMEGFQ